MTIKVKVKYKQTNYLWGLYDFSRIIKYKKPNSIFWTRIVTVIADTINCSKNEYLSIVKDTITNKEKEKRIVEFIVEQHIIENDERNRMSNREIKRLKWEKDIDLSGGLGTIED